MKQSKSKQIEHTSVPSPPRVNSIPRRVVMVRYAWHVSLAYHAWREWACWAGFSIKGQCAFARSQGLAIVCVPMLILCKQPKKIIDTSKNILGCLIVNGSDAEKLTTSSCHEPPNFDFSECPRLSSCIIEFLESDRLWTPCSVCSLPFSSRSAISWSISQNN